MSSRAKCDIYTGAYTFIAMESMLQPTADIYIGMLVCCVLMSTIDSTHSQLVLTSSTSEPVEGSSLSLTCTGASHLPTSTEWYMNEAKTGTIFYADNNCSGVFEVNNYTVSCTSGDSYTLTVMSVQLDLHNTTWYCIRGNLISNTVILRIAVPVKRLSFDNNGSTILTLRETDSKRISCTTSYSRPMANVTWYITDRTGSSKVNLPESSSSYTTSTDFVSTTSTLEVTLNRTYDKWMLVCEAENVQDHDAVSTSVLLNVTYPTKPPVIQCTNNGIYKVVQNTSGRLTCSVDGGNPAGTVHWNCTGDKTEYRGLNNNVTQTIVWTATQTQYCTCTVTNVAGIRSISVMTEVLYPPVIYALQDKAEFEEESVTLQCIVLRANPSVSVIRWTSNKHNISEATLLIPNVSRIDGGMYRCTANNTMDPSCQDSVHVSTSRSLHMDILYPPSVNIPHGKSFTFKEGDRFSYTCLVEPGNPPSTNIMWRRSNYSSTWSSSELLIHNITRYDDGIYTCYAGNVMVNSNGIIRAGNVSADIRLIVQFKTNVTDFYIQGYRHTSSVTVMENASLVFECHLHSNPISTVRLYDSETLVNTSKANMLLYYTWAKCSGKPVTYSCHGNNSLSNTPSTRQIQLVINCKPRRDMNVDELVAAGAINETVTLTYTALAYPLPSFTWHRDGLTINTTDERTNVSSTMLQTNLTILHVTERDFGNYTLTVANDIGSINESIHLKPQGVPEAPTHLTQDDANTATSIIALFWTSGFNNGLTQQFTIMYRQKPGGSWQSAIIPDRGPTRTVIHYNITGLSSDSNYEIVLYAVNDIGRSKYNATLTCKTNKTSDIPVTESSSALIGAIGGSVAGLVLIGVIIIGVFIFRRRVQKQTTENPETSASMYENVKNDSKPLVKPELNTQVASSDRIIYENAELGQSKRQMSNRGTSIQKGAYVNFANKYRTEKQSTTHEELLMKATLPDRKPTTRRPTESDAPPPIPAKTDYTGLLCKVDDYDGHVNDDELYTNTAEHIENVFVHELFDFVAGKSFESFAAEFNVLPKGLTMPCTVAVKQENIKLNRYNGIFPYDHSRVTIPDDPDFFTNACYMDGYKKEKSYIASLGPTADTSSNFKTFWRMVWHEQSDIIVMVTNLREITGMKCEQYWPKFETSIIYGEITVTSRHVEEYAEYTVRTFNVSHDGKCRTVTQLHFTAWPDKGVPDDLTSLLEFRQRIISTPSIQLGPVIVHCSAGIGRTGTLIALDRLILEGKATNSIDVFTCVRSMRQQRVSMVQTQEQYMYIYKACVYALAFECNSILAEKFHDTFKSTTDAQFADLFKKLKTIVDNQSADEKIAILNNKLENSNRANADIAGDRHRVRLYVDKESEDSDYTNAVYINSFKTKNKFITAQTPLKDFVQDFVCTVFQEQCVCVVDMDGNTPSKGDVGVYLPAAKQSVKLGNFTISCDELELKPQYTVNKMKIENTGKFYKGEWSCYHFKYHDWKYGKETPGNTEDLVDLLKDVNEYADQFGEKESHILIHCLDGSYRSGLFCFVACLLEKIQCERQVNVGNTLRQVRTRRQTTIRTTNQLKFCFKTVNAFIETNSKIVVA